MWRPLPLPKTFPGEPALLRVAFRAYEYFSKENFHPRSFEQDVERTWLDAIGSTYFSMERTYDHDRFIGPHCVLKRWIAEINSQLYTTAMYSCHNRVEMVLRQE